MILNLIVFAVEVLFCKPLFQSLLKILATRNCSLTADKTQSCIEPDNVLTILSQADSATLYIVISLIVIFLFHRDQLLKFIEEFEQFNRQSKEELNGKKK